MLSTVFFGRLDLGEEYQKSHSYSVQKTFRVQYMSFLYYAD